MDSSPEVAQELAKTVLGVSDPKVGALRQWLAEREFHTTDEEAQALCILSKRSTDASQFAVTQERRIAAAIYAFAEKCRVLTITDRSAKRTELVEELDSVFTHAANYPRLARRRAILDRALAIEPSPNQLNQQASELAERLVRMGFQQPRQKAASRCFLLKEARGEVFRWSSAAVVIRDHYPDVAALDATLIEELVALPALEKQLQEAKSLAAATNVASANGGSSGSAVPLYILGVLISLGLMIARTADFSTKGRRSSGMSARSSSFQKKPSKGKAIAKPPDLYTRFVLKSKELEDTVASEDGTIADRVELIACYMHLGASPELYVLHVARL